MTNTKVNEHIRGWIRATMLDIVDRKTHMLLSSKATRNEKLDGASHFIRIDDLLDRNGEHEAALGPVPKGSRVQEEWLGPMHHATAQTYCAIGTCLDKWEILRLPRSSTAKPCEHTRRSTVSNVLILCEGMMTSACYIEV